MVLNYIWVFFFVIAFITAIYKLIFDGDVEVFQRIIDSTFSMSKTGFELSLGLTGVLTLWMGIMKIGERGGAVNIISKLISPFFRRIFPDLKKDSPAYAPIMMNIASNILGLDNAATPMGLKAMEEMQKENPHKDIASNPQIMFLVMNTSGLTIIPVSIMVYRAQMGASNPADVFLPILIATFISSIAGLLITSLYQKINLFNKVVISYILGSIVFIAAIIWYFSKLDKDSMVLISGLLSNIILFSIIISFILMAFLKKINVYEAFIDGAKDGFKTAVKIIPYLIAILVGIGVFRASGFMDMSINIMEKIFAYIGLNTEFIPSIPTALMKPLSGSGARGMMVDTMNIYGVDSFVGRLSCIFQGATDTTFYIIAVYFGSVKIRKTRHAVICGLFADIIGIIAAILLAYMFFK